jgi:pre-mRNA 3'-end-processing factor FIP1
MPQQMYQGMDGGGTPVPQGRGTPQGPSRGRMGQGIAPAMAPRGRGNVYAPRGRGRGMYGGDGAFISYWALAVKIDHGLTISERPPIPVRPASPLPPGVPTGPRNQNKYKDRDGNAPAVDGLDYGGTNKDGVQTPLGEEDRSR